MVVRIKFSIWTCLNISWVFLINGSVHRARTHTQTMMMMTVVVAAAAVAMASVTGDE